MTQTLPVHESLTVTAHEDIYKTDEWWKSVVRYSHRDAEDHSEVAVYLWHKDGDWTRKNKYVVKTAEAWETDCTIIGQLFADDDIYSSETDFPTSDYYNVASGKTVFKEDDWWKAIVRIDQKGDYETEEVVVYLWQKQDGDWRRRQKYTLKSAEKWQEEATAIESVLDTEAKSVSADIDEEVAAEVTSSSSGSQEIELESEVEEFETLSQEIDDHLSGEFMD
jgi:hypothetical protein